MYNFAKPPNMSNFSSDKRHILMQKLKSYSRQSILSGCEGTEILQSSCRQPTLKPVNIHHIGCHKQTLGRETFHLTPIKRWL